MSTDRDGSLHVQRLILAADPKTRPGGVVEVKAA
jgi:hypothetical protein